MQTIWGLEKIPANFGPSAVTIGKFDGVHLGHVEILKQLNAVANDRGLIGTVVTFDKNPRAVLTPGNTPDDIVALEDRLALIEQQNVEACLVLTFDQALSSLSAEDFAQKILREALDAKVVLAGHDFKFGENASGNISTLRSLGQSLGFEVVLIDDVTPQSGVRASSSLIRQAMASGDIATAHQMLGRYPKVKGEVVHGAKRGRELGFPTANLSQHSFGLVPAEGVYAGWFYDGGKKFPCAISVGTNPTFEGISHRTVEAFLLDQNLDLYGHEVEVEFVEYLRGMVAFTGIEPLIEKMHEDVLRTRKVLGLEK